MNKQDLVKAVAKELGTSKAQGERSVNAVLCGIAKGVKKDKNVQLIGFGSFAVKKRKARTARNPQTGETIKVKASRTVGFKVGKKFKAMV
ncbi:MAG: DNA binding protein HU [Candidatus Scalindua rubra]|uniref:DNA binding protein HU n=1 Tax=Candidatus Scalindua rubra TaxID=1872076 RepID=A0A1E3X9D6_9BACT|nr:MAG: DNA binding protein HU [Candidatus Scalindua rubra]